tara:strand:- start:300 stop:1052 length:753 start_codon:yes stop_codon:yes gene_type:complete
MSTPEPTDGRSLGRRVVFDIRDKIVQEYGRPEEYLTEKYPSNYFDYFIDIGARGIVNPWHLNFIAKASPNTLCIGYEPDIPYYEELREEIEKEKISNAKVHPEGFGTGEPMMTPQGSSKTVTIKEVFENYNLDPSKRWSFKIDCEGGEYALLDPRCSDCVELLKQADHLALEFHTRDAGQNFFTGTNILPATFDKGQLWMMETFANTHRVFLTSAEPGLRTFVLLSETILSEMDDLFWNDILTDDLRKAL